MLTQPRIAGERLNHGAYPAGGSDCDMGLIGVRCPQNFKGRIRVFCVCEWRIRLATPLIGRHLQKLGGGPVCCNIRVRPLSGVAARFPFRPTLAPRPSSRPAVALCVA